MFNKHILAFFFCFSTLFMSGIAKTVSVSTTNSVLISVGEKITAHPRLLLKEGEEQKIKKLIQTNSSMLSVHECILSYADEVLTKTPLERKLTGKRLLTVSNEALKRIYYLSYAYRMTKETKYAERAEKEMIAVCEFENWNPTHFLDVAEMTIAVAIGYDWLFSSLSETTRVKVRQAILENAFTPANDKKYAKFYKASNNWNQVCNTGLVFGALAIYEDEPKIAQQIIDKSLQSIPIATQSYGPDGAYPEGYMYWGYGTGFQVSLLAALETALGTDYNLSKDKGFLQTPYYMLMMVGPSGSCYNYGDSGLKPPFMPGMYWFAAKLNNPALLYQEQQYLSNMKNCNSGPNGRLLPNVLIFSKDIELKEAKAPNINFYSTTGNKPLFIYRSGWKDKNDAYLGVVGGRANASHGHMDAGSFVYEKNGVRWSLDLGLQSYSSLESKGVDLWNNKQDGQRWDVFRIGSKGHSTMTINGERHLVVGEAKITNTFKTKDCKGAELDLTPIFANSAEKVIRKVYLDAKDDLNVTDKIKTNEKVAKIAWQMVAPQDAKIVGTNQIELTKDGQKMLLTVNSPTAIEMKIWPTQSENSFDEDNPGTIRVGFETSLPANTTSELIINLASQN
jgi:Heparinase II/III-like protein